MPCLQKTQCQTRSTADGKPTSKETPSFHPTFLQHWCDYFGPLLVKERRSTVKRYGCLFTCIVTRAVHLEVAHSLETDSFIMALRRMMARRGKPRNIYSDNGINFVGAERELKECLDRMEQAKISDTLSQDGIQWFFNPPSAPHFGGVWERLVKSAKKALKITLNGQLVNDEALLTFIAETESLLNSRPLTHVSVDPQDLEAISPNHFLIGRNSPNVPPDVFDERDLCSRKRWRQAQTLTDHFWRRWLREYVPALTERKKWRTRSQTDVQIGDLVLVVEDNLPRGKWNLGQVVKTFPGNDGLIRTVEVQTKQGTFKRPVVEESLRRPNVVYRLKSYTGVALLPTALRSADSFKIGLSSPQTRDKTCVSGDPPSCCVIV